MEIVDSGRRRRFTDEAKLAIVAESYNGPRQVTATAQRHGITRWQLNAWRRAAREGRLVHRSTNGFVPAIVVAEPAVAKTTICGDCRCAAACQRPGSHGGGECERPACDRRSGCRRGRPAADYAGSGDVAMNPFPMGTGVKVWLSTGHTDMRCGFASLALRVQEVLK
ncbi:transposase, partial [Rhizobium johnstonii]